MGLKGQKNPSIISNKEHQPSSAIKARLKCAPALTWSGLTDSRSQYGGGGGIKTRQHYYNALGIGTYMYDTSKEQQ